MQEYNSKTNVVCVPMWLYVCGLCVCACVCVDVCVCVSGSVHNEHLV